MEFGMFHEFQNPPGASAAEAFRQSFEQVDAAERWGLDAMWLAELHFAPERSVLASPLILAAAIAQRTKRMKIGTAVQVLPLSVEYCQVPVPLSKAVTAMPFTAPLSTSLTWPLSNEATVLPPLAV